jgi:hypothetical protein
LIPYAWFKALKSTDVDEPFAAGAPAKTDAQQFLADLLAASRATLAEPVRFGALAKAQLAGPLQ